MLDTSAAQNFKCANEFPEESHSEVTPHSWADRHVLAFAKAKCPFAYTYLKAEKDAVKRALLPMIPISPSAIGGS